MKNMKKLFSILVLALVAMTAGAAEAPTYSLSIGTSEHGTISFKVGSNTNATAAAEGQTVTVTITPDDGWSVNQPVGEWIAAEAKAPAAGGIPMEKDIELTLVSEDPSTRVKTYTFTMIRANAEVSATYKKLMTNDDITIGEIANQTYTGSPLTPAVEVKDGSSVLVKDVDYTVAYSNNTNAGTATVTITGVGDNYDGVTTTTFTIDPAACTVTFYPWKYVKTVGDEDFIIEPETNGDGTLAYYSDNKEVATVDAKSGLVHIVGPGKVRIYATLSGDPNYTRSEDWYELTVNPDKPTVNISATGMATYCCNVPLDFTGINDLEAYTVIGSSYHTNTIWMSRVYDVPAGMPVVIMGKEGSYVLDKAAGSTSYYRNKLEGNLSGTTIQIGESSGHGTLRNYYLKDGTFKTVNNFASIESGKAYLPLPADAPQEMAGNAVSVKLSSTGRSTLCSDVDLDFADFDDELTAYVVTGYDQATKTFWLSRVIEASAGTPLYLFGKANTTYSIPSKGVQTVYEDMLVGNLSGSTIQVEETSEADDVLMRNYYLKDGMFKLVNNYVNIANGKCYLQLPSALLADMAPAVDDPTFNFIFNNNTISIGFSNDGNDGTTGISVIDNEKTAGNADDNWYDLQGRRVVAPQKGVYIKNGRKVVVK